jgi:hypothetical protein
MLIVSSIFPPRCYSQSTDSLFVVVKEKLLKGETIVEADAYIDQDNFKKRKFHFLIDSSLVRQLWVHREKFEKIIVDKLDQDTQWLFLASYLNYSSATPKLKEMLLVNRNFYRWEGPDYTDIESFLYDLQFFNQMNYIIAIEHISGMPFDKAIQLKNTELEELKNQAKKCSKINIGLAELDKFCYCKWLLRKLHKE